MLKILGKLKPYWVQILLILGLTLGNVYAELFLPNIMSGIVNVGIMTGDKGYILAQGLKMLGFAALAVVCAVAAGFFNSRVSMAYGRDLRAMVFKKVTDFSLTEYDRFGPASLLTRTINDISQLQQVVMMGLRIMVRAPLMIVGGVTMAYSKSPELFRVIFFSVPMLILLVVLVASIALPLSTSIQQKIDRVNRILREKLTGIRVQRAFGTELYEEERFDGANRDLTRTGIKMNRTMAILPSAMTFLMTGIQIFLAYSGAVQVDAGTLQVGDIMAVIQYVMQIMMSLTMFAMIFIMLPRAIASGRRVLEVMNTPSSVCSADAPRHPGQSRGLVEFRDVTFSYGGAQTPALQNLSFTARPGQTTAIIGGTGSGKTTLLNLLPRFYDAAKGAVLVDGVDVRELELDDLRGRIGYVPQRATLFKGTIADNIRYGKEDASEEEIRAAARIAQAEEFISAREEGYDAPVSQLGANLSGGQKQRLSIARAVVRRPEIYLFDDSFSALDAKTDLSLRKALGEITGDATVIIVAQKVSTIIGADQILVLDKGECVGLGTHEELLKTCEVYREIAYSQHSTEEAAG